MKVIVQIPCFNEAATLPLVVRSIPRAMPGVDEVQVLVVDDGSTDGTADVARRLGVDYIVSHHRNRGLAAAFRTGLQACVALGADVIVNTDGDNQYPQAEIPRLLAPILERRADMVIADRQVGTIEHFSPIKKLLQKVGSWVVRQSAAAPVSDAPSGFRALTREVAERINLLSTYSYTIETLIQAGRSGMTIVNVPIRTNESLRESRLMRSIPQYLTQSALTIVQAYAMYEPLRIFLLIGALLMLAGLAFVVRWVYYFFQLGGDVNVQSLIVAGSLFVIGFQVWVMGLLGNLIGVNRRLLEELLYRSRQSEHELTASIERVGAADRAENASEPGVLRIPLGR